MKSPDHGTESGAGAFMTWGWQFALTLGLLAWSGHWMDERYETRVLFTLVGIFVGLFGGFYNLFRIVSQLPKPEKKEKKNESL